jgi:hypothetical protein
VRRYFFYLNLGGILSKGFLNFYAAKNGRVLLFSLRQYTLCKAVKKF